ncbi:MAG: hypothetical protein V5A68_00200 [Candidatus Thermoplasmatota archaeon]
MNLKKSDKIIAIVGAIILIIAAVGIALYTTDEEQKEEKKIEKENTYKVECEEKTENHFSKEGLTVKDGIIKNQPYIKGIKIKQDNLKSVSFKVNYNDDISGFLFSLLFNKFGRDTLSVKVMDKNGEVINTKAITGSGNITIKTPTINKRIMLDTIDAESLENASKILEERYKKEDITYEFEANLQVKEKLLFRFFAWVREKILSGGDTFDLTVEKTYYDYNLVEIEDNYEEPEDDDNDDGKMSQSSYQPSSDIIKNIGYGTGQGWI